MGEGDEGTVALPTTGHSSEAPVVKEQVVEEVLARLARGEPVLRVARAWDLDPKTVRAWRRRGAYRPRQPRRRSSILAPYQTWLQARAPEVDFNAAVLFRELRAQGYPGSAVQVSR